MLLLQCRCGAMQSSLCPWRKKQHGKLPISVFGAWSPAWFPSMTPERLAHLIQFRLHASESLRPLMFSIGFPQLNHFGCYNPSFHGSSSIAYIYIYVCLLVATCQGVCFGIPTTSEHLLWFLYWSVQTSARHLHVLISCLKGRLTFLFIFLLDASFSLCCSLDFCFFRCVYIGGRWGGGIYQHLNF